MKNKGTKRFIKLTNAYDNRSLYIAVDSIAIVHEVVPVYNNYNNGTTTTSLNMQAYPNDTLCIVSLHGSSMPYYIKEHYMVVMALVEGKDPTPAQVIYGQE